jgi:hypothetical protein
LVAVALALIASHDDSHPHPLMTLDYSS